MGVIPLMDLVARAASAAPGEPIETRQPALWSSEFITYAAAVICLFLRLASRRITGVSLWMDDYIVIAGFLFGSVWMILIVIWIQNGLGLHIHDHVRISGQSFEDTLYMNKLILYIAELFYAVVLFLGKAGVLAFYWRMFKTTSIKRPIQILAGCACVWIVIRTIISIFHCTPVQAFWDSNAGGYCAIDDTHFFFGTLLVHLILDIAIMSLPISELRKLQLPMTQKLGVMAMFLFGIFICVAALVIIVSSALFDSNSPDVTWTIDTIIIWASAEVNLVTISACIPVTRPALRFIFTWGKIRTATDSRSAPTYGMSQSGKTRRGNRDTTHHRNKSHGVADDSGSTYELANSINQHNEGDFDAHAVDGPHNNHVTIMGHGSDSGDSTNVSSPTGIMVKSETTITHSAYRK